MHKLVFLVPLAPQWGVVTGHGPVKLLLVDDAVFARDFLLAILAEVESGIEVTWRSDYATGLEALLTGPFDVCLLDYQLGDRSGLDLLREAKARGVRLPIIMLTGHGSAQLLVAIARRLESCVRLVDTVARLGGDEFVVLLDESREPDGAIRGPALR